MTSATTENVWDRYHGVWGWLFLGVAATTVFSTAVRDDVSPAAKVLSGLVALALVLGFRVMGRNRRWCHDTPKAHAFVLCAIAAWVALVLMSDSYFFLLIALYPLIFSLVRLRVAAVYAVLLTLADIGLQVHFGATAIGVISAIGGAALGVLFALWITAIIDQSAQRKELIEQLEAAQAGLAAAERDKGMMAERERLAGEIHDTLAQGFTSILMLLQAAEAGLPAEAHDARRQLELAEATARENLEEARRLVAALAPAPLAESELSLVHAVERLARRLHDETGIDARVVVAGHVRPMHPASEVAILRVAQESLTNVRKHARATQVTLTLAYNEESVTLDVTDNGVGFDVDGQAGGFGLRGMRQRLAAVGGRMDVESSPGGGTTVTVALR